MSKTRVLFIVRGFPQISQTYLKSELEAIYDDYEVRIISRKPSNVPYRKHYPFQQISSSAEARDIIHEFQPHVLHTHYLNQLDFVGALAAETGTPFTVRSHSFDTMALRPKGLKGKLRALVWRKSPQYKKVAKIRRNLHWANHELCLGVLGFPWARPFMEGAGVERSKIIDCPAIINYDQFHDTSPNGEGIMNTGAAIPKKRMEDFIELARMLPEKTFDLYAMGYRSDDLQEYNEKKGGAVNFMPIVQPEDMPAEYKKHQWLVYTADFDLATVGWPMAVAEAQASGTGVCMPNIRPDLKDYVGDAGFLYDSIEEVKDIISRPVPEIMRQAGFEQARRSDIQRHKHLLTDLWDKAASRA
ncbi:glycosyltransferase [Allohahella marinimesophila]|uniref:Glycosyltransferase subfamily 4-like N-terminal domain-containing protein n=1 Tax=Allohahella marinimesophila TaxID=1054972 RepID=A0ABP7PXS0_9GAMM